MKKILFFLALLAAFPGLAMDPSTPSATSDYRPSMLVATSGYRQEKYIDNTKKEDPSKPIKGYAPFEFLAEEIPYHILEQLFLDANTLAKKRSDVVKYKEKIALEITPTQANKIIGDKTKEELVSVVESIARLCLTSKQFASIINDVPLTQLLIREIPLHTQFLLLGMLGTKTAKNILKDLINLHQFKALGSLLILREQAFKKPLAMLLECGANPKYQPTRKEILDKVKYEMNKWSTILTKKAINNIANILEPLFKHQNIFCNSISDGQYDVAKIILKYHPTILNYEDCERRYTILENIILTAPLDLFTLLAPNLFTNDLKELELRLTIDEESNSELYKIENPQALKIVQEELKKRKNFTL